MTTFLLHLRNRHFFILDLIALSVIPTLALVLRLDGSQALSRYAGALLLFTSVGLAVRLLVFWRAGLYGRYWRYASTDEIALIVATVAVATAVNTLLFFALHLLPACSSAPPLPGSLARLPLCAPAPALPRSIPLIDGMLLLMAVGGSRFSIRMAEHWHQRGRPGGRHVLIIGAGDAGRMIAREMQSNPQLGMTPIGFVDDDPAKHGMQIHGLPVLGDRQHIPELVRDYKVRQAIIAMPTAPGKTIRQFFQLCEQAGVEAKTVPGIFELLSGQVSVSQIRNVEIEDLLRREPVNIVADDVARMIRGTRVLITGAGGSIGSEICRQVAQYGATELILLGHGENSIFRITRELRNKPTNQLTNKPTHQQTKKPTHQQTNPPTHQLTNKPTIHPVIADIRDLPRLEAIFHHHQPHIVFHAAAHKHVPLMESNVEEAVSNNVLGTQCLIEAAEQSGVERFVLISTDKAVNPCSVMGATKRVAEKLVEAASMRNGRVFVAVRFGNVLGSRGSVVNIFKEQIARGGPVTVTDPEMRRYFMTIPEAVQLVLQAAALGEGGEVFVLDMGKPVRIVDLARDLIELSGLEVGRDIDIEFVGARPGEKLFEELFAGGESYHRTHHEKIFVARNGNRVLDPMLNGAKFGNGAGFAVHVSTPFEKQVEALIDAAQRGQPDDVRCLLGELVPQYGPAA